MGRTPVALPEGVTVEVVGKVVNIKGPKGTLTVSNQPKITIKVEDGQVILERKNDEIQTKAFHGLVRSLVANAVQGVNQGFKKTLKLVGTGYRVAAKGQGLSLSVGFSHSVEVEPTEGVSLKVEGNDTIHIEGIDKQLVGQVTANIRKIRPPEPYKGKGIKYEDEAVRRKAGKTAAG